MNQEAGPHQTPNLLAHWPWTSSLHNCEKRISVVCKPPNLWYFVIVAQTDEDMYQSKILTIEAQFCLTTAVHNLGEWVLQHQVGNFSKYTRQGSHPDFADTVKSEMESWEADFEKDFYSKSPQTLNKFIFTL